MEFDFRNPWAFVGPGAKTEMMGTTFRLVKIMPNNSLYCMGHFGSELYLLPLSVN